MQSLATLLVLLYLLLIPVCFRPQNSYLLVIFHNLLISKIRTFFQSEDSAAKHDVAATIQQLPKLPWCRSLVLIPSTKSRGSLHSSWVEDRRAFIGCSIHIIGLKDFMPFHNLISRQVALQISVTMANTNVLLNCFLIYYFWWKCRFLWNDQYIAIYCSIVLFWFVCLIQSEYHV